MEAQGESPGPRRLNDDQIAKLLEMSLGGGNEEGGSDQIGRLLERLTRDDGEEWFREESRRTLGLAPSPEAVLIDGSPDLARIDELKRRCKQVAAPGAGPDPIHLAGYYLAVACALRTHGILLSGMPASTWYGTLRELELIFPEPWDRFFREARLALEELRRSGC